MKRLLLALSLIAGTTTAVLAMQQKPSQAKAYIEYEPNYMYISNYEIKDILEEDTKLHITFTGTFKYFNEKEIFHNYIQKYIVYELNTTYDNLQFKLLSLYSFNEDAAAHYGQYYQFFKDTKENDTRNTTLTIINNKQTNDITYSTETDRYVLVIEKVDRILKAEVINDIVEQTLNNLKIANSKYAQDKITSWEASEDYIYKQGYNAGFYAGQQVANKESYGEGYDKGYFDGLENGIIRGKNEGFEEAYNKGYNEAMENLDTEYSKGYKEGYDKAIRDAKVLPETIFTTIGSVAGFIGQLGEVEILGISLLDVFAMITIVGVIMLITKVAL